MSDHEYTLTVRPNAHLRVAYNTDRDGLERAVLAVEYGRDGLDGDDDEAASGGIEWRGYEVTLARDGQTLLGREGESAFGRTIEELLDREGSLADDDRVRRGVDTAKGYGRRLRSRIGAIRDQRSSDVSVPTGSVAPDTVEIPGPRGATIDVSLTETEAAFELYEDDGANWRWRLVHDDDGTLAVSPSGYDSRDEAEETISELKTNVLGAEIED